MCVCVRGTFSDVSLFLSAFPFESGPLSFRQEVDTVAASLFPEPGPCETLRAIAAPLCLQENIS